MKIVKKTLMAAAIMAMSTSAMAANSGLTGVGSSDILFTAVDTVAGTSYTFDLSILNGLNDLVGADNTAAGTNRPAPNFVSPGSGVIYSGLLSGFGSFLSDAGGDGGLVSLSNVVWNLAAGDGVGRWRDMFTSTAAALPTGSSNTVKTDATAFTTYAANVPVAQGGFVVGHLADGNASGLFLNTYTQFADTFASMGSSADLLLAAQRTTASSNTDAAWFGNVVSATGQKLTVSTFLDGNSQWNVQIAAVPEADSYAMFLAGIGLMGFIARRRMQG